MNIRPFQDESGSCMQELQPEQRHQEAMPAVTQVVAQPCPGDACACMTGLQLACTWIQFCCSILHTAVFHLTGEVALCYGMW